MSHHHKHEHCCSDDHSCGQEQHNCCCHNCCCGCHDKCGHENSDCCGHEHSNYAEKLLCLADCAWTEILKEKIKEEIKSKSGSHIDELAKVVAEANCSRWEHKLSGKKVQKDFRDKLSCFFDSSCCEGKCDK